MQCQKTKRDGSRCRARVAKGKKYCPLHAEPGKAAQLGSRGGRRRTVYSPEGLKGFAPPKTAADLRDLLAQSIVEIRSGRLEPRVANAISYLGAGFLRAVELADIEARLELLEEYEYRKTNEEPGREGSGQDSARHEPLHGQPI